MDADEREFQRLRRAFADWIAGPGQPAQESIRHLAEVADLPETTVMDSFEAISVLSWMRAGRLVRVGSEYRVREKADATAASL